MTTPKTSVPQPSTSNLRFKFRGDHSDYHCGCVAVVDYLRNELLSAGTLHEDDEYDYYVLNGEGTMHHDSPGFLGKMTALKLALSKGKRAYLINTVWQENSTEHDEILRSLSGIIVREQMSHDDLWAHHRIPSLVRLDASYHAAVDETAPFTDWQGSVVMGDFFVPSFQTFMRHMDRPAIDRPFVDMRTRSWSSLVKSLRTASILVTGRQHAVFAACRARTPFVALEGNTHKIQGMVQMSGLPIPICTNPRELEKQTAWATENRSLYCELFEWMDQQPRFTLADLGLQTI